MAAPKNCEKTTFITKSINSGDSRLHPTPSMVRLYFFLKSRFTSSSKRNWYCFSFTIIGSIQRFMGSGDFISIEECLPIESNTSASTGYRPLKVI